MSNAIGDLLARRGLQEPPEMKIIKDFVNEKFQVIPGVTVNDREIVISVKSAALAGALRPYLWEIGRLCNTQKRLVIRIQQGV